MAKITASAKTIRITARLERATERKESVRTRLATARKAGKETRVERLTGILANTTARIKVLNAKLKASTKADAKAVPAKPAPAKVAKPTAKVVDIKTARKARATKKAA